MTHTADPDDDASRLSRDELTRRAGEHDLDVDALVDAGILRPDVDGRFQPGDLHRLRIVAAFERSGVPLDAIVAAMRTGTMSLTYYDELHPEPGEPSERTYAALQAELGPDRAALLERLLTAFGVVAPPPEDRFSSQDEAFILEVLGSVESLGDPELGLRVARLYGENARRAGEAALDVYRVAAADIQPQAEGLPNEELYRRHLRPWAGLARTMPRLAAWLTARHLSTAIDAYSVAATEEVLEQAGFVPERDVAPPAVAFVDLTGFTRLTDESGDDAAASIAMRLATLAEEAASLHAGRVVKLLGDGVLLRFDSPASAVQATLDLLDRLEAEDMPSGHVGVAAGPLVVREGDVFGATVNIASRLADRAHPKEVLLTDAAAAALPSDAFDREARGSLVLKGVSRPVEVFRVGRSSANPGPAGPG